MKLPARGGGTTPPRKPWGADLGGMSRFPTQGPNLSNKGGDARGPRKGRIQEAQDQVSARDARFWVVFSLSLEACPFRFSVFSWTTPVLFPQRQHSPGSITQIPPGAAVRLSKPLRFVMLLRWGIYLIL